MEDFLVIVVHYEASGDPPGPGPPNKPIIDSLKLILGDPLWKKSLQELSMVQIGHFFYIDLFTT